MEKQLYASGTSWESAVGYARAIRVGDHVYVSGTTATSPAGGIVGVGDAGAQAAQALDNIRVALAGLGAEMRDVVRTRIFVVDIDRDWEAIGRAHAAEFAATRPATSMVEVRRLISADMLVEIEAEALVSPRSP